VVAATTIKVSYAPEHEVYARQVTADTAVLQHLHHPSHGWGWMLFFLEPGGHRVGDYFIPGDLTDVDDAVDRARRRLSLQHADNSSRSVAAGSQTATGIGVQEKFSARR
jgi:hypothetical protein